MASARAIATRCCWPPESCAGYLCACSGMPTRSSSSMPTRSASLADQPRTRIGASVMFCEHREVREEVERLEDHPDLAPDGGDVAHVVGELDAVDDDLAALVLLEPVDGADERRLAGAGRAEDDDHLAGLTVRSMPRSTWSWPNHLCTSRQTMISSAAAAVPMAGSPSGRASPSSACPHPELRARAGSSPATSRSRARRRRRR